MTLFVSRSIIDTEEQRKNIMNRETEIKFQAAISGKISPSELSAITEMLSDTVLDINGNPLDIKRKYWYRNNPIRITEIKFGSGNFMDTYYWVWYLDHNLDSKRVTIDGKHTKKGTIYKSEFSPSAPQGK